MQRVVERGEKDRFELEQTKFFERVRQTYLQLVQDSPERFILIDASRALEQVQVQVMEQIDKLITDFGSNAG